MKARTLGLARCFAVALGGLGAMGMIPSAVPSAVMAQGRQVLTHETLWMMKRVGSPSISPDGRWVVYAVNEPAYDPDKAVSDLWLVPADGSTPPRRITNTKGGEDDVAWAPDSHRLAFSAKREGDEDAQIYVLDVEGGEAQRVTGVPFAARKPQWRPDGHAILFEASVWPGATDIESNRKARAERKDRKFNMRTYDHSPVRYWNEWYDDRRPSLWVQSLDDGKAARDILSGTALYKEDGFFGVANGDGGVSLSPRWSPDGKSVVFVATTERWNAAFANVGYRLWTLPLDGGEARELPAGSGSFSDLAFTPDGRHLLFNKAERAEEVYSLPRLKRLAWYGGTAAEDVTPGFDREPAQFAVTPDSKTIFMLVPEGAAENLYRVPVAGGTPQKVIAPAVGGYTALDMAAKANGPVVVGLYGSAINPVEVVRIDPAKRSHRLLTQVNVGLAATIDWASPERFVFTSAGGRQIHNLIIKPPAFDPTKRYPLFVMMHGGPASSNPDQIGLRWNYHLLAAAGYVVLMSDYTGSTGYGEAFARAIKGDPLKTPADEINQAVDEAVRRYPFIDATNACAGGASYGGHLANWMEGATKRYKCLVSHAGEADLLTQWGESDFNYGREVSSGGAPWGDSPVWRDQSPVLRAATWSTPMLMTIGERDYRVPLGNTLIMWTALQRMKVPSRLLVFPDAWHWITKPEDSRQFYREVHAWLAHYLKNGPVPKGGPVKP